MFLGPIMLDIAGLTLTDEDRELLQHPAVGGVILFARNYANPQQLTELTTEIRALRAPPLLIAVDQEGGRVQRFREGFRRLPSAASFAQRYANDAALGQQTARMAGWLMAAELQAAGVDFSFAPVLDVDRGLCRAIGDRAFAADPNQIATLASAWLQGVRLAGMASVGKHFPGHGGVEADSHLTLPCDNRPWETLWQEDLVPFRYLIDQGLEAIMPSHVVYAAVDGQAAGFSMHWLQSVLRQQLGFQGVIMSDALDMNAAAAAGSFVERSQAALKAGCDLLLLCNNRPETLTVVEALGAYQDPTAQARLARLYSRHYTPHHILQRHPFWEKANQLLDQLANTAAPTDISYDPTTRGGTVV